MTLAAVSFDTDGMQFKEENTERKVWLTADGDAVLLYYFGLPPDLPEDLSSDERVRGAFEKGAARSPIKIVEAGRGMVGGCRAVRAILKAPQQPTGMTYLGSVTLPFRDFSYVIKVQCVERGTTGTREAILFDRLMGQGKITVEGPPRPSFLRRLMGKGKPGTSDKARIIGEWDPDDRKWDEQFPEHPVSRVRRVLSYVEESVVVDPAVRASEPFGTW